MTQNQIRYLEAKEQQRSNLAKEAETERSNKAKEAETKRYNDIQHGLTLQDLAEKERSNLENERRQRESLEYEKYGKSGVGGTVRTIKAGLDDIFHATQKVGSSMAGSNASRTELGVGAQTWLTDAKRVSSDDVKKYAEEHNMELTPQNIITILKLIEKERFGK